MTDGCNGDKDGDPPDLDPPDTSSCLPDSTSGLDAAQDLALGTAATDTFCPRTDEDFWRVTTGAAGQVVGVDVTYAKLASMRLALEWWGMRGRCVRTGAACSQTSECNAGEMCDLARGTCRATEARRCLESSDCEAAETCALTRESFTPTPIAEAEANAAVHRLRASLPAPLAGEYVLKVWDLFGREEDARTTYSVTAAAIDDPDANEPNDGAERATPVNAAAGVEQVLQGVLAYHGDIDWYRVSSPALAAQAVIEVDLSWPDVPGATSCGPTWTLVQQTWTAAAPAVGTRGTGAATERFRKAALVTPASGDVLVRVEATTTAYDPSCTYMLRLTVRTDPYEAGSRNDTPAAATVLSAATTGSIYNAQHTLVAINDADWFRVDRPASSDATLLTIAASAPATADYLLRLLVYERSSQACTSDAECTAAGLGPCLGSSGGVCLAFTGVQRPPPYASTAGGIGDPQEGGLSPNDLVVTLPVFAAASTTGTYYIRVGHIGENVLGLPGYDADTPYTLTLQHDAEPDAGDHAALRSEFVGQPLGVSAGELFARRRAQAVVMSPPSGGGGGSAWVGIDPAQVLAGGCVALTLRAFDATGAPKGAGVNTDVDVGTSAGALYQDCTLATPIAAPITMIGPTHTIGLSAASVAAGMVVTVTTSGGGLASVGSRVSVVAAAIPQLRFDAPPTRFAAGTASPVLLVRAPSATSVALPLTITVEPAGAARLLGVTGTPPHFCLCGVDNPCGGCAVTMAAGAQTASLRVTRADAGIVVVTLSAPGYAAATQALTATAPRTVSLVASATGYISYDGDQDWFELDAAGFPPAAVRLTVSYPASNVDLRVRVARGEIRSDADGTGIGFSDDVCVDGCAAGGVCDGTRRTCTYGTFATTASPGELDPAQHCSALRGTADSVYVWVNDADFNDGDRTRFYSLDLDLVEGCPLACSPAACGG